MKKVITLVFGLFILISCSQEDVNEYSGENGTYVYLDSESTALEESNPLLEDILQSQGANLQLIMKYTNSTDKDQIPVKAMEKDMVVVAEVNSESPTSEEMTFREPQDADIESDIWYDDMGKLYESGIDVVKPGESVEFLITTDIKSEYYNSLYLRSADETEADQFEKKIELGSTPI